MSATNPLIADNQAETVANAAEALDAVLCLLAESQDPRARRMFMMLSPVCHALTHATEAETEAA